MGLKLLILSAVCVSSSSWAAGFGVAGTMAQLEASRNRLEQISADLEAARAQLQKVSPAGDTAQERLTKAEEIARLAGTAVTEQQRQDVTDARTALTAASSETAVAAAKVATLTAQLELERATFRALVAQLPQTFQLPTAIAQTNIQVNNNQQPPANGGAPKQGAPPPALGNGGGGGGNESGGGGGMAQSPAKNESGGALQTSTAPATATTKAEAPPHPAAPSASAPTARTATRQPASTSTASSSSVANRALSILNLSARWRAPARSGGTRSATTARKIFVEKAPAPRRFMDLPPSGGTEEVRPVAESGHRR